MLIQIGLYVLLKIISPKYLLYNTFLKYSTVIMIIYLGKLNIHTNYYKRL